MKKKIYTKYKNINKFQNKDNTKFKINTYIHIYLNNLLIFLKALKSSNFIQFINKR